MSKPNEAQKFVHLIAGTPDDDCPICRAHGVGKGDQGDSGCSDAAFVEELSVTDILRCPCPMCAAARQEVLGSGEQDSPA